MRSIEFGMRRPFCVTAAVLIAGTALLPANSATAQYVYQPAPGYYQNDTAGGTIIGGALGAITGAAVAGRHDRGAGALIGAGVGAVTGNLLGRSKDANDERRAAAGAAAVGQMNQQAAAAAVTNFDLQQMTQAGISEDVIISTMRSRGARVDLSPQSLIAMKQQGISDRVVLAAQQMGAAPSYYQPPGPTVVSEMPPPPTTVFVEPGWRPYRYYYPPPCYYHHPHTYVRVGF